MNFAIDTITRQVTDALAPFDAKVKADTVERMRAAWDKFSEFRNSPEADDLLGEKDSWGYYNRIYGIFGGKSWYMRLNGHLPIARDEIVGRQCDRVANARNAKIAAKLAKEGVTAIVTCNYYHSDDGFNGVYVVTTDKVVKTVRVNAIFAGGYNIQCAHIRVLVSVKNC